MKFLFHSFIPDKSRTMCVDGAFDTKIQLSHWHGNRSPEELKADTTTGMAFKLLEHPDKEDYLRGIDFISNNHYDADGLIACYVLLYPDHAIKNRKMLIDISITGDFQEFTTEDAFKCSVVLDNLMDEDQGLFKKELAGKEYADANQYAYEKGFELIPKLLETIDDYELIWSDEFAFFLRSEESFEQQKSIFSNYPDIKLSVIESSFKLHTAAKFKYAENDIVLSAVKHNGGTNYELEYKTYTWFDTVRKKSIKRRDFESLAGILNQIEKNKEGSWKIYGNDPVTDFDYRLNYSDEHFSQLPSSLAIFEVENILFNELTSFSI